MLKPHATSDTDLYYKTKFYQPRNGTTEVSDDDGSAPAPSVVPWVDVLKHTAFLTLSQRWELNINFIKKFSVISSSTQHPVPQLYPSFMEIKLIDNTRYERDNSVLNDPSISRM